MKTNLPNFDEAKLTAYALNELDAADRAEVEKLIAINADARRWVAEVRQTAAQLQAEFQGEECPALTTEQTRAIQQKMRAEKTSWWNRQWLPSFRLVEALAVIAVVAILAAMLLPATSKSKSKVRHVAMVQPPPQQLKTEAKKLPADRLSEINIAPPPAPVSEAPKVVKLTPLSSGATASAPTKQPAKAVHPVDAQSRLAHVEKQSVAPVGAATLKPMPGLRQPMTGLPADLPAPAVVAYVTQPGSASLDASGAIGLSGGAVALTEPRESVDLFASDSAVRSRKDLDTTKKAKAFNRLKRNNPAFNTESYASVTDNPFLAATENPLSTFSIDVDTASYANVRRFLTANQLPPPDAVRIEELVNYFSYNYPQPKGDVPFSVNVEIAGCPWTEGHRLVRVGLKGREIARDQRLPSNLVFLIDVSGSMDEPAKLPLLKESLKLLTRQLNENDHVSIVVYAGAAGMVLPETSGSDKATILRALDKLEAGGSTHGSAGIKLAYETATENFIKGGVNRVILCTDGDFNVGVTSQGELTRIIQAKAKSGVFLSVLGFGMGNYKDSTMEMLADKGNGNYAYIDNLNEGRKVLVEQMSGTLVTIAKDVKIQIEFNPAQVNSYRLIGYENRLLAKEDFNNDKKDAGEIGAGHTITALYEVVPAGMTPDETPGVDPLKYQKPAKPAAASHSDELLTLKLRYKQPDGDTSRLLSTPIKDADKSYNRASTDFKFAAAVAEFGMLLRHSPYAGEASLDTAWEHAKSSLGKDPEGYRAEFLTLVETAQRLTGK